MKIDGQNLSMIRGDSETLTISCADPSGVPLPFGMNDTVYLTVKTSSGSETKCFQKSVGYTPAIPFINGKAVISITPNDTRGLAFGTYVYDIQWNKSDGSVITIVPKSKFTIEEEVTYE